MPVRLIKHAPHVAILLAKTVRPHRDLMQGVFRYAREHGPWVVRLVEGRSDEQRMTTAEWKNCDGCIGDVVAARAVPVLKANRIPTIGVDNALRFSSFVGSIRSDNAGIGAMAAEWMLGHGYTSFAAVGAATALGGWSEERRVSFARRLRQNGYECRQIVEGNRAQLGSRLRSLPTGTAVFVVHDIRARQVLDACLEVGISVPRDLAILSFDNDETLCEMSSPTLSSIQTTAEAAGYEAARLLDEQMHASQRARKPTVIPYTFESVVERQSTERLVHHDPFVEQALDYMRLNFARQFTIDDLADLLKVSRRFLEKRFKSALGHSPHAELLRRRLAHAKVLIQKTDRSYADIAAECGLSSQNHLCLCFKKHFGRTPSSLRSKS